MRKRSTRVSWRGIAKYVSIFALGLLILEILYVIVANALLASSLVRDAVGSADGLELRYATAYSWFPGRVQVNEFDFKFEDYNVQLELKVGRANIDVKLIELLSKQFHVTRLRAHDFGLRLRHKVHGVGDNGPRLKAYPPIAGFAGPPLYHGSPPPPTPNPESLWSVRIENVVAQARELWALEYRFQGDAEARGAFLFRPALLVRVEPSMLELRSGTLKVGQSVVANAVHGHASFEMPHFDVPSTHGRAVFREMSGLIELSLAGGDLDFLDVYTEPRASVRVHGAARWEVSWQVDHGLVTAPSKVHLRAPQLAFESSAVSVRGAAEASLARKPDARSLVVNAALNDVVLLLTKSCSEPPRFDRLSSSLELQGLDLSRTISPGDFTLAGEMHAPELACVNPFLPAALQVGGSAIFSTELSREASGHGKGSAKLQVFSAKAAHGDEHFRGNAYATANFRLEKTTNGSDYAQGSVSLRLTSADSLLSSAMSQLFRNVVSGALNLDKLQATVAFYAERDQLQLELTTPQSGAVTGKGHWRLPEHGEPSGALLLSAGPVNVGIALNGSHVNVSPLVSGDWLSTSPAIGGSHDAR